MSRQSSANIAPPQPLTSGRCSGRQRWRRSRWRQVEVQHGAIGLVADHHTGHLRPLSVPHQAGGVPGQRRQVGLHWAAARHEAADRTLLAAVRDGLRETRHLSTHRHLPTAVSCFTQHQLTLSSISSSLSSRSSFWRRHSYST